MEKILVSFSVTGSKEQLDGFPKFLLQLQRHWTDYGQDITFSLPHISKWHISSACPNAPAIVRKEIRDCIQQLTELRDAKVKEFLQQLWDTPEVGMNLTLDEMYLLAECLQEVIPGKPYDGNEGDTQ